MSVARFSVLIVLVLATPSLAEDTSPQFQRLDRNRDGKLTKDEFPRPLFDRIDTNQDGIITAEEDKAFTRRRPEAEQPGAAPLASDKYETQYNVPYADTDNPRQTLDLYLPKNAAKDKPLPVVAFIHGGGWQNGNKAGGYRTLKPLVESGDYAAVSIGYRLSGEAIWPAQIHDCKAAIRWIKANAKKYNLDPERIGVTGTSAGGHLVAMLGTSARVEALEGTLGPYRDVDSRVACVVDQFGPTDLLAMGGRHDDPQSPESKLIGGPLQEHKDAARAASPVTYVSIDDPPFMILHGTEDGAVPFNQSKLLAEAMEKVGAKPLLIPVVGAGHGNFGSPEPALRMKQFFDMHLLGRHVDISKEPISSGPARGAVGSQR